MTRKVRRHGACERDALRPRGAVRAVAPCDEAGAALIGALPEATWLVDADTLRVRVANAAAARLLGLPEHALRGRSMSELCTTPEDLAIAVISFPPMDHPARSALAMPSPSIKPRKSSVKVPVS